MRGLNEQLELDNDPVLSIFDLFGANQYECIHCHVDYPREQIAQFTAIGDSGVCESCHTPENSYE